MTSPTLIVNYSLGKRAIHISRSRSAARDDRQASLQELISGQSIPVDQFLKTSAHLFKQSYQLFALSNSSVGSLYGPPKLLRNETSNWSGWYKIGSIDFIWLAFGLSFPWWCLCSRFIRLSFGRRGNWRWRLLLLWVVTYKYMEMIIQKYWRSELARSCCHQALTLFSMWAHREEELYQFVSTDLQISVQDPRPTQPNTRIRHPNPPNSSLDPTNRKFLFREGCSPLDFFLNSLTRLSESRVQRWRYILLE